MPSTTTVRVDQATRETLRALAEGDHLSIAETLRRAVEAYRRERFLARANEAYAELRGDAVAWEEELAEREVWESTVADGLEPEGPE